MCSVTRRASGRPAPSLQAWSSRPEGWSRPWPRPAFDFARASSSDPPQSRNARRARRSPAQVGRSATGSRWWRISGRDPPDRAGPTAVIPRGRCWARAGDRNPGGATLLRFVRSRHEISEAAGGRHRGKAANALLTLAICEHSRGPQRATCVRVSAGMPCDRVRVIQCRLCGRVRRLRGGRRVRSGVLPWRQRWQARREPPSAGWGRPGVQRPLELHDPLSQPGEAEAAAGVRQSSARSGRRRVLDGKG